MGPIETLLPKTTPASRAGESIGQGFSTGLNYAIQDMLQNKQMAKKAAYNSNVNKSIGKAVGDSRLGELLGATDPQESIQLVKMLMEQGGLQRGLSGREAVYGLGGGGEGQGQGQNQQQGGFDQEMLQNIPIQHRPAIDESAPSRLGTNVSNMESEKAEFKKIYDNEKSPKIKALLLDDWNKQKTFLQKEQENKRKDYWKGKEFESQERQRAEKVEDTIRKDYFKPLKNTHERLQQSQEDLKVILELSKGKGSASKWKKELAKHFNLSENLFLNPDEEVIEKMSNNLMPGVASKYAGTGRILASEASSFAKSIPTLMQTEQGREITSRYIMKSNELKEIEYQEAVKLAKEFADNEQPLPRNFEDLVQQRADPKQRKILDEMHSIYAHQKPGVPSGYVPVINLSGKQTYIEEKDLEKAIEKGYKPTWQ